MGVRKLLKDASPQAKIKQLEKLVARQAQTIEDLRAAKRGKLPKARRRRSGKNAFIRVVFGDVHGDHMDEAAVGAFLNDVEMLQPSEIVCIGDLLDCGGFLSQHKTLGVVAELDTTYEQDVQSASMVLDELQKRAPTATLTLIEGNHEHRINRWICDQVLGNSKNAEYLRRLVGPRKVLNLDERGVRYVERHEYYDNLSISGTIKLSPHAIAQHGEAFCGKYAAFQHLQRLGKSIFFGHTHRLCAVYTETLDGLNVAVNTGCLCSVRPLYGLTKTTDWSNGYAAQFCDPDSGSLALPVPIIGGESYLSSLIKIAGL